MVDLNTATAEELDTVPALKGHGFEIVRYREERGRFTSLRQLDEVPALAGRTDGLENAVTVGAPLQHASALARGKVSMHRPVRGNDDVVLRGGSVG